MPGKKWRLARGIDFFLEDPFHGQKGEPNPLRQRLERFERSEAIERLERFR